ncbi:tRNA (adenosine(37)-N6)-dimethylallyltransferase MiaA [Ammoniphilus oxalaticus]|uniref:tRNA dimethylallyltransferase n=1 Tax=Ammoniphilus oxalaticus TaxID=66863 RepID=A0A419SK32_9BACL|nr:tRNA (adenosine(37)-N6)-dimethylallyltransferase MiaA [Ammoniphilus oxalaticus]RKD24310.1 tRNA (adenosine(37)-N6)-dimethylallyltransferase MiaA [Ammoniphilus oxalaticus]
MKEKLLVIVGPTAVGKTALSIELALKLQGEVISGDSMQVYRGMDIGTAKITSEEMRGVPHHLIDIHDPTHAFSAAEFQGRATELIHQINQRNRLPMIVGGTGLYVQSVIYQYEFSEAGQDEAFRSKMEQFAEERGREALHEQLRQIDPVTAQRLHPNDLKRVIRALEIYELTGATMAEYQNRAKQSPYELCLLGLTMDRAVLYERINLRVDLMIEQGLVDEVERLLKRGYTRDLISMQGIGYKEIVEYLEGNVTLPEAIESLKQNTRNFAKRQLTWFRSMKEIEWIDLTEPTDHLKIVENICSYAAGKILS